MKIQKNHKPVKLTLIRYGNETTVYGVLARGHFIIDDVIYVRGAGSNDNMLYKAISNYSLPYANITNVEMLNEKS